MKRFILLLSFFTLAGCSVVYSSSVITSSSTVNSSITDSSESTMSSSSSSVSSDSKTSSSSSTSIVYPDSKEEFYQNYLPAVHLQDAMERTRRGLLSGDKTPQGHIPLLAENQPKEGSTYLRLTKATYGDFDENLQTYQSYRINRVDGSFGATIYRNGAYTSLNEVAAYLYAFGEVPVNSNYDKNSGRESSIAMWGEYGRVNKDYYNNDVSRYKYEPELPLYSPSGKTYYYTETDFGTLGGYTNGSYTQIIYNDGNTIERGAARFVFTSAYQENGNIIPITDPSERRVFYTYNHYNDFQEYLNYEGGFGQRFGFETAGNPYCSGMGTSRPDSYGNLQNIVPPLPYATVKDCLSFK